MLYKCLLVIWIICWKTDGYLHLYLHLSTYHRLCWFQASFWGISWGLSGIPAAHNFASTVSDQLTRVFLQREEGTKFGKRFFNSSDLHWKSSWVSQTLLNYETWFALSYMFMTEGYKSALHPLWYPLFYLSHTKLNQMRGIPYHASRNRVWVTLCPTPARFYILGIVSLVFVVGEEPARLHWYNKLYLLSGLDVLQSPYPVGLISVEILTRNRCEFSALITVSSGDKLLLERGISEDSSFCSWNLSL